jgi:cell division protein FtsA
VRIGSPKRVGGLTDVVSNPSYSTAVGLVLMGMQATAPGGGGGKGFNFNAGGDMVKGVLDRMKKWFGDSI